MSFMVLLMAIMVFFMGFSICFWGFYGLSVLGGGGQEMCLVPESRLSWSGGFGAGGFPAEQELGVGDTSTCASLYKFPGLEQGAFLPNRNWGSVIHLCLLTTRGVV